MRLRSPMLLWLHAAVLALSSVAAAVGRADDPPCRDRVRTLVCDGAWYDCEPYVPRFLAAYDRFPRRVQELFCRLGGISIHAVWMPMAGSSPSSISLSKPVLDEALSASRGVTWLDRLPFAGAHRDSYEIEPGLPSIRITTPDGDPDALYWLLAHELAHVLDGSTQYLISSRPEFYRHSWIKTPVDYRPDPSQRPAFLEPYTYFFTSEPTYDEPAKLAEVYEIMGTRSAFPSFYGMARGPGEDFAEAFAYYLMESQLGARVVAELGDGREIDVMANFKTGRGAEKYELIRNLLQ
jgi:hypothetical protein